MSYKQQSIKYLPYAYWDITGNNGGNTESPAFGTNITLTKSAGLVRSNRSVIYNNYYQVSTYSDLESSVMLQNSTSTITIPTSSIYWGRTGYSKKPFSINFCFQQISSVGADLSAPIFSIGNNINLYFTGEKVYLNFLGKISYVAIPDKRELLFISIIYDGDNSMLIVNNDSGTSYGTVDKTLFESSPTIKFSGINSLSYQVNGLAFYNYAISRQVLDEIYAELQYDEIFEMYNLHKGFKNLLNEFDTGSKTYHYSPSKESSIMRNVLFSNEKFYLPSKPMALTSSVSTSTTGITVNSGGYINIQTTDIDTIDTKITISLQAALSSASGTVFEIESSIPIKAVASGTSVTIYNGDTALTSQNIGSSTSFSLIFSNGSIFFQNGSGSVVDLQSSIQSSIFNGMTIGNSRDYSSNFSQKISTFSINYYTYPLTNGKYFLDFRKAYSTSKIKPVQDGVVLMSIPVTDVFDKTIVDFSQTGNCVLKTFLSTNSYTDADWYKGAAGTTITSGSTIKDASGTTVNGAKSGADIMVNMSILLTDSELSSNNFNLSDSTLSNMAIRAFVSPTIYSPNSPMSLSSADSNCLEESNYIETISKSWNPLVNINTTSDVVISNLDSSLRTISFVAKFPPPPGTGSAVDFFTLDGTTSKLQITYGASTFSLTPTSITTVYVDGRAYTSGSALQYNNVYLITLVLSSASYTSATFKNCRSLTLAYFGTYSGAFSSTEAIEQSSTLFSKVKNQISDTTSDPVIGTSLTYSATLVTGSSGKVFTVSPSTDGMIVGQTLTKVSGAGAFGVSSVISSIDSKTQITVSVNNATAGAIVFTTGSGDFANATSIDGYSLVSS